MNISLRLPFRVGIDDSSDTGEYSLSKKPLVAIVGSFDLFHNGHIDQIQRARKIFPCASILVVVYDSFFEKHRQSLDLRTRVIKERLHNQSDVSVVSWRGLSVPSYIAYTKGADFFYTTAKDTRDRKRKKAYALIGKILFPTMKILISRKKV